jgi:hypothetical protein
VSPGRWEGRGDWTKPFQILILKISRARGATETGRLFWGTRGWASWGYLATAGQLSCRGADRELWGRLGVGCRPGSRDGGLGRGDQNPGVRAVGLVCSPCRSWAPRVTPRTGPTPDRTPQGSASSTGGSCVRMSSCLGASPTPFSNTSLSPGPPKNSGGNLEPGKVTGILKPDLSWPFLIRNDYRVTTELGSFLWHLLRIYLSDLFPCVVMLFCANALNPFILHVCWKQIC